MAKQIELPMPTKVPKNWCWMELGKLTSMKSGYPFDSKRFTKEKNRTTRPLIRIRDVVKGKTETYTDQDCPEEYIIKQGEILIGMDGDFNVAKWQSEDALLNQRVCCIKSSSSLYLNDFLFYYLPDPLKKINDATPSVTVKHLSTKTLAITPVPVPPIPEQQRIVDRIESLFEKLDEAKQKAQDALDSFETRKAAILHKAFTGELTARWRKEHSVGMDSWEEKTINDIGDVKGGKRIPKGMELTYENTGHPYLKAGNLKQGTVIASGMMYVTDEILQYIKNYTVSAGDVYITNVGACIGDCGVIPQEYDGANLTENAVKITNLKCNNKWLSYYLSGNSVQQNIKSMIASATLGKLSIANIKKIELNVPTCLDEQTEIVRILDDLLSKEQQVKETAEAVLEQIDLIKKSILARAFRGELGTNNLAEESAVELVKNIIS